MNKEIVLFEPHVYSLLFCSVLKFGTHTLDGRSVLKSNASHRRCPKEITLNKISNFYTTENLKLRRSFIRSKDVHISLNDDSK